MEFYIFFEKIRKKYDKIGIVRIVQYHILKGSLAMKKTNKLMKGVLATAGLITLTTTMTACNNSNNVAKPPKPKDASCKKWDWDKEMGVWECDDKSSSHHGSYYYGGGYYPSRSSLNSSPNYQSYSKSSSFAGKSSTSISSGKSGIGSGSKGGSVGG